MKLFRIKQSTESNHENKKSEDVVPLPSRVRKNCGLSFDFVLEVEKKEFVVRPLKRILDYRLLMMVCKERNAV